MAVGVMALPLVWHCAAVFGAGWTLALVGLASMLVLWRNTGFIQLIVNKVLMRYQPSHRPGRLEQKLDSSEAVGGQV
jgi:hypothetical protein